MANDLKRGIRVYLESSDYGKGIEDMIAKTKKYETSLSELTDESKKMTAEGTNSGKAWDDLQTKIKRTGDQVKKSQAAEEEYAAKLKQTEKVLNNLSGSSYNELIAVQKKLQTEVRKGSDTVQEQETKLEQLQRVNGQVASSQREMNSQYGAGAKGISGFIGNMSMMPGVVGYVGRSVLGLGDILKTFLISPTMIAITAIGGLIAGMFYLAKNALEFGKAVSNLSALTGAVGKDLDYLKAQAKSLGKDFGLSAVDIVEAMKMVGSAKPELLNNVQALSETTQSVLTLSKATGMDLSEATQDVTTIMNQFGLSALDSNRTVNVLAAGSKYGAKEVDYLGESISKVGTISKAAGLSLETTTAIMELFGEKGIKAEVAGNGFKKVLVQLQSDTKNYTNGIFDLNKAIDNNQNIAGNNIALQKKFGQEFFGLAQILFQNKDRFAELTKQVTGTSVAEEQMRVSTDNLSGDMDKMKASWNAFTLSLEDGKGPISTTFRSLVQWAKDSVDAMASLTKNSSQRESDLIAESTNNRIESLKKQLPAQKDQIKYLNEEITAEKNIYGRRQARIEQLKEQIRVNNELGGDWTKSNKKSQEEIDGLNQSVTRSIAYVNAVGGLRAAIKKDAKATPAAVVTPDKPADKDAEFSKELEQLKEKYSTEQNMLKEAKLKEEPAIQIEGIKYALDTEQAYADSLIAIHIKYLTAKRDKYVKGGQEWQAAQTEILDIQLKSQEDGEKWLLKSVENSYKAQQKATNTFEKTAKSNLINDLEEKNDINRIEFEKGNLTYEEFLDKNKQSQEKYNSALLALQVVVAEKRLKDAKDHAELIDIYFIGSESDKAAAVETANAEIEKAGEALSVAEKAVTADKLKDEKDYYEKKKAFRDKFGLDSVTSIRGQYEKELAELKLGHGKLWVSEQEYQNKVIELKAKAAAKYAQQAVEVTNSIASFVTASNQAETDSLEAEKEKQLTLAGDDATKHAAIEKEFAQKSLDLKKKQADVNMVIQTAQAVASGALGIANIWGEHAANPVLAGILTALEVATVAMQISSIVSQRNAIKNTSIDNSGSTDSSTSTGARVVTPQAASGRWDVIGADDGRTYMNVPYSGVARTGIVTRPTLMGERGDELIVDNPTLRNIRMNEPWLISRITRYRVQQRAGGNYSSVDSSSGGGSASGSVSDNTAMLVALDRMISFLQYLIDNGVKAPIVLSELEAKIALRDKSLNKGSIK